MRGIFDSRKFPFSKILDSILYTQLISLSVQDCCSFLSSVLNMVLPISSSSKAHTTLFGTFEVLPGKLRKERIRSIEVLGKQYE